MQDIAIVGDGVVQIKGLGDRFAPGHQVFVEATSQGLLLTPWALFEHDDDSESDPDGVITIDGDGCVRVSATEFRCSGLSVEDSLAPQAIDDQWLLVPIRVGERAEDWWKRAAIKGPKTHYEFIANLLAISHAASFEAYEAVAYSRDEFPDTDCI